MAATSAVNKALAAAAVASCASGEHKSEYQTILFLSASSSKIMPFRISEATTTKRENQSFLGPGFSPVRWMIASNPTILDRNQNSNCGKFMKVPRLTCFLPRTRAQVKGIGPPPNPTWLQFFRPSAWPDLAGVLSSFLFSYRVQEKHHQSGVRPIVSKAHIQPYIHIYV